MSWLQSRVRPRFCDIGAVALMFKDSHLWGAGVEEPCGGYKIKLGVVVQDLTSVPLGDEARPGCQAVSREVL